MSDERKRQGPNVWIIFGAAATLVGIAAKLGNWS